MPLRDTAVRSYLNEGNGAQRGDVRPASGLQSVNQTLKDTRGPAHVCADDGCGFRFAGGCWRCHWCVLLHGSGEVPAPQMQPALDGALWTTGATGDLMDGEAVEVEERECPSFIPRQASQRPLDIEPQK